MTSKNFKIGDYIYYPDNVWVYKIISIKNNICSLINLSSGSFHILNILDLKRAIKIDRPLYKKDEEVKYTDGRGVKTVGKVSSIQYVDSTYFYILNTGCKYAEFLLLPVNNPVQPNIDNIKFKPKDLFILKGNTAVYEIIKINKDVVHYKVLNKSLKLGTMPIEKTALIEKIISKPFFMPGESVCILNNNNSKGTIDNVMYMENKFVYKIDLKAGVFTCELEPDITHFKRKKDNIIPLEENKNQKTINFKSFKTIKL